MTEVTGWTFGLGAPGGWIVAALLAALLAVVVTLGVADLRTMRPRRRVFALAALRLATGIIALLVAVQPRWLGQRVQRSEGRIAVLADTSRSMSVGREGGAGSRAKVAAGVYGRWAEGRGGRRAVARSFGAEVRDATLAELAARPDTTDEDTRIADAVRAVARREGGELGAVVIVSDGADRTRRFDAASVARLGVRVHAVAIGAGERLRDDTIARVEADPVAFLRQPARVRVVVRSDEDGPDEIPVTLRAGDQVVREAVARFGHGRQRREATVELQVTPSRIGRAVYRVSIPVAPEDAVPENNERAFLVRVTRDRLRVLLVCGRPSWDERFLRAFLEARPVDRSDLVLHPAHGEPT